jgi:hypothetical protein
MYQDNMNSNANYKGNRILGESIKPGLSYIADSLERMFVPYFLAEGTLIGWYRDCGVIPHTDDADLAMPIEHYTDELKQHFLGNPHVNLWAIQGSIKGKNMEFKLVDSRYHLSIDLFFVYKFNQTHDFIPIQLVAQQIT